MKENIAAKALAPGISQGEVIVYFNALEEAKKDLEYRYNVLKAKMKA